MACKVAVVHCDRRWYNRVSCALVLMRKGHQVALIEEASIGHSYSWGNGAQYNLGSTLPMAYPGVAWRALSWLTKENGPVGLAPRELLRTVPSLGLSTSCVPAEGFAPSIKRFMIERPLCLALS